MGCSSVYDTRFYSGTLLFFMEWIKYIDTTILYTYTTLEIFFAKVLDPC